MRTFSFIDSIIDAFYCANWEPMTIAVPMNGDLITLTPTFMNGIKDESHMNGLKVEGAPLPLEGSSCQFEPGTGNQRRFDAG